MAQAPSNDTAAKTDAQLAASLTDALRQYRPHVKERHPDMVEGRYQIDLGKPLPEFNTKNAQAYAASDKIDSAKPLLALVCKIGSVQRHRLIPSFKGLNHPNLSTLVAADVVLLSQPAEERFVLLYRRPPSKKLSEMLAALPTRPNEHFIIKNIIMPLASAIQQLAELGVNHGSINPNNIYYGDGPVLGDCISEPCGYSQPFLFEPVERMQAAIAGKGEGTSAHDYYALAVLALYALMGPNHFAGFTQPELILQFFKEGPFNALTRQRELPDALNDFFRGCLTLDTGSRWGSDQVIPWAENKRYTAPTPPRRVDAVRPFEYGDNVVDSKRELAHLIHTLPAHLPHITQHNHLVHWIAVSLRDKELSEQLARITRTLAELGTRNEVQFNEQIMHLITLLDPDGPVRFGPLSFFIDGVDALCVDFSATGADKNLQMLAKFIEFNMGNFWMEEQRRKNDYSIPITLNNMLVRIDRLRVCIRNTGFGFGIERMIYELNPDMPCLSPFFAGRCVRNLSTLLTTLDQQSSTLGTKDQDPIDRHLAAYIGSKLNLQHEIRVHELEAMPTLANHRSVIALRLLSLAQDRTGVELPGITHWLGIRLLPVLDQLKSNSLRHEIKSRLAYYAKSGDLKSLSSLVIGGEYATADSDGFNKAWNAYQTNIDKIARLKAGHMLEEYSMGIGFIMAKVLAYGAFVITFVCVLQNV